MTLSKALQSDTAAQEYLIFRLGDEEYGIDILKVQAIRGCHRATRVPTAPASPTRVTHLPGGVRLGVG